MRVALTEEAALNITIGGVVLEQVSHFRYLGSQFTDGRRLSWVGNKIKDSYGQERLQ